MTIVYEIMSFVNSCIKNTLGRTEEIVSVKITREEYA
jgi:hypothetical protein